MEKNGVFQIDETEAVELVRISLKKLDTDEYLDNNNYKYDPGNIRDKIKKEYDIRESNFAEYILKEGLGKQLAIFH